MALSDIIAKITFDAEQEVSIILESARQEVRRIEEEARGKKDLVSSEAEANKTRRASKVYERLISKTRHEVKIKQDQNLRLLVDAVFQKTEEKLSDLPENTYQKFLVKNLQGLPPEKGVFSIAPERDQETRSAIKKSSLKNCEVVVEKPQTLKGGFIFSTTEREFDCSFRALIQALRQEAEVNVSEKIASTLYG